METKFIRQGEKHAVKYADEIIVLSEGVQKYFMDTYGRKTNLFPMVSIVLKLRAAELIQQNTD